MSATKPELAALSLAIGELRPHVRDTGDVKFGAVWHQANVLADRDDAPAEAAAPQPLTVTDAMIDAATAEADKHINAKEAERRAIVAAILGAALAVPVEG